MRRTVRAERPSFRAGRLVGVTGVEQAQQGAALRCEAVVTDLRPLAELRTAAPDLLEEQAQGTHRNDPAGQGPLLQFLVGLQRVGAQIGAGGEDEVLAHHARRDLAHDLLPL